MLRFYASLFFLVISGAVNALAAEPLSGPACVIDGDTLALGSTRLDGHCSPGVRVRLFAIDAPESHQTCTAKNGKGYRCGEVAAEMLREMIAGRSVACERRGKGDRYGRVVAVCSVGGVNLNDALVRKGWAVAYRRYGADFIPAEDEAKKAQRGLWSGTFTEPAKWRQDRRG